MVQAFPKLQTWVQESKNTLCIAVEVKPTKILPQETTPKEKVLVPVPSIQKPSGEEISIWLWLTKKRLGKCLLFFEVFFLCEANWKDQKVEWIIVIEIYDHDWFPNRKKKNVHDCILFYCMPNNAIDMKGKSVLTIGCSAGNI